ncbi:MAG: sulfur reduction protein DsrE [Thermoprotei archaeon]|nr:MAG: sulfur reduction protein DsrE [Thermoprotei archaeon]RLF21485.1 MAG: sulfur reduction protein DsrE [Thermoprotei archaeon]
MATLKVVIKLLLGPYTFEHSEVAVKIAEKALERGAEVILFLYMDGVHCVKKGQKPREFANIEEKIAQLACRGVKVVACMRCATARGYSLEDVVEGSSFEPLHYFAEHVKSADVVITIGK